MATGSACDCYRKENTFCSLCEPQAAINTLSEMYDEQEKRIKTLEKVMRAEAALILRERFSIDDEAQVERLRLSACRLVDAVKYK